MEAFSFYVLGVVDVVALENEKVSRNRHQKLKPRTLCYLEFDVVGQILPSLLDHVFSARLFVQQSPPSA